MCYLISMIFYLLFYLFAMMMNYVQFQIYDFVALFVFLLLYKILIRSLTKFYFLMDGGAALTITVVIYLPAYDLPLCCFFFLTYFIVLESFTYTYLDVTKYDNTLTKS